MRHAHAPRRQPQFIDDPDTGKRYPVPQGGDENDDDAGDQDGSDEEENAGDADDAEDQDEGSGDDSGDDGDAEDDKPLGPAGEKALREMKKRARAAERELRKLRAKGTDPDDAGDGDADDTDPKQLRAQVEAEVRAEAARDRALDKLEARAARKFQNPDLARKLLADQADDFLDEQGNPDVEAITEALDELLEDEPYLGLDAAQRKRFEGNADGGTRNGRKAGQLTDDDLSRMSPDAIEKALAEGKLDTVLGRNR